MSRFLLGFFCTIFTLQVWAGGILKGRITDIEGKPLPGTSILIKKNNTGAVADSTGQFVISGIAAGNYLVQVSHVGYISIERNIVIKEGEITLQDFLLEHTYILTSEVVVTATRSERQITQVPGRVDVINNKTVEAIPILNADDLMQAVPGVQVSRGYGIFSNKAIVTMRGLGGKEQSRVLVLVDGIPLNKTDGGSVNWNLINTANIDRIEVAKGPGSSLYGSDAMGGIIQILTKRPDKKISGSVTVRGGSYLTLGGNLWLGGKSNICKKNADSYLYWTFNGFGNHSNGYYTEPSDSVREADSTIVPTYLKEYGGGAKLGYVFNANHSLEAEVNYYDDWRGSGTKAFEPTGGFTRHNTLQTRGRYRGQIGKFQINANIFLQRENYHAMNESFKDYMYKLYDVSSVRTDLGLILHVTQPLFKNNILTEGIDLHQGAVDAADVYYTSTDKVNNAGKMNFYAVFLQDEYSFLKDKLSLVAGIRYDYSQFYDGAFTIEQPTAATSYVSPFVDENISDASWQAISPKVSLQYRPLNNFRTYLAWAKGFRPPILDDMCRSGKIRGGFKIANPSLKPETINNFEWGFDLSFLDKIFIEGSAYYSLGKDFMYYVSTGDSVDLGYYPLTPVYIRKNISQVEIYGAEFGLNYFITPQMNIYINYAYTHSQIMKYEVQDTAVDVDITSKFLADVPKHFASAGFAWRNRILNFCVTGRYTGKMFINDKNEFDATYLMSDTYPDYFTMDVKIWKLLFHHLNLALDVQNVFNYKVYDSKNQVSPGRMIFGEISYKF
jgi:iron complex outermembrane receptor protein